MTNEEKYNLAKEYIKLHEGKRNYVYKNPKDPYSTGYGNTAKSFKEGRTRFVLTNPRNGKQVIVDNTDRFGDYDKGKFYKWKITDEDVDKLLYETVPDYQDSAMTYRPDKYITLSPEQQAAAIDAYYNGNKLGNYVVDKLYDYNNDNSIQLPSYDEVYNYVAKTHPKNSPKYYPNWTRRILDDIRAGRTKFYYTDLDEIEIDGVSDESERED